MTSLALMGIPRSAQGAIGAKEEAAIEDANAARRSRAHKLLIMRSVVMALGVLLERLH